MNDKTKFTPGPWVASETPHSSYQNWVVLDGGQQHKRQICPINSNNEKADAYLIAAAPDMYEVLEECASLLIYLSDHLAGRMGEGALSDMYATGRDGLAALAKARGES